MTQTIVQLHPGPIYQPSNGEEIRVWKTAQKFSEYGQVYLVNPGGNNEKLAENIRSLDPRNPFLNRKSTRIYLWNALLGYHGNTIVDRLQARRTVETVRRHVDDIDLVVCEKVQMLRASIKLAAIADAPLLSNKHNAMYELLEQQLESRPVPESIKQRAVTNLRMFEQRGINASDAVVFQSESDVDRFEFANDARITVIPNGCNFDSIDQGGDPETFRKKHGLDTDQPICLFIGAYDYEPNEIAATVIAEHLAPSLPDIEFLLVGREPPSLPNENITVPGFVDDLPAALNVTDVAVCPLTKGSGTKLKIMDYLAAGLPIVTTRVGAQGIPLSDGENAMIRDDPAEMATAIRTVLTSTELRETLSRNAKQLGRRYSWEELFKEYDDVVGELLAAPAQ